jgi:hypothetical protein
MDEMYGDSGEAGKRGSWNEERVGVDKLRVS